METLNISIEKVKKGDFLRRKEGAKKTFVKGVYNRSCKAYECHNYEDINEYIYIKPGKIVNVNFDF